MNLSNFVYQFVKLIVLCSLGFLSSCEGLDFPEVSDVYFYSLRNGGVGANSVGYFNGTDMESLGMANGLEDDEATAILARDGSIIYVFQPLVGLAVSKNAGDTFTTKPGAEDLSAELFFSKGRLFILGFSDAWVTEDDGDSYTSMELPITGNTQRAVSGNTIAIGMGASLYLSTNSGQSFELLENTPFTNITVVELYGSNLLVGGSNGAYFSSNKGSTWNASPTAAFNGPVTAAGLISGDIYVITGTMVFTDLYISGDKGQTYGRQSDWEGVNVGLPYRKLRFSEKQVGVLHNDGVCTAPRNGNGKPNLPFICSTETGFAIPTDLHMVDGRLDLGR